MKQKIAPKEIAMPQAARNKIVRGNKGAVFYECTSNCENHRVRSLSCDDGFGRASRREQKQQRFRLFFGRTQNRTVGYGFERGGFRFFGVAFDGLAGTLLFGRIQGNFLDGNRLDCRNLFGLAHHREAFAKMFDCVRRLDYDSRISDEPFQRQNPHPFNCFGFFHRRVFHNLHCVGFRGLREIIPLGFRLELERRTFDWFRDNSFVHDYGRIPRCLHHGLHSGNADFRRVCRFISNSNFFARRHFKFN